LKGIESIENGSYFQSLQTPSESAEEAALLCRAIEKRHAF
jgi:hypothetical protein